MVGQHFAHVDDAVFLSTKGRYCRYYFAVDGGGFDVFGFWLQVGVTHSPRTTVAMAKIKPNCDKINSSFGAHAAGFDNGQLTA